MRVRQALVLVGGKGTRLGSATATTPKPLLEVAPGIRFLDLLLEQIARHGFTDIILLAGHQGEQVEGAYNGRRVREASVRVVREPAPAGTAGALAFAAGQQLDRWFLLMNGDSYLDTNLRALALAVPAGVLARMALRLVPDASRYGSVILDGEHIAAFHEKSAAQSAEGLVNGGIYLLSRAIVGFIKGECSLECSVFPALAARGKLIGMRVDGYFIDIGTPISLAQARGEVFARTKRAAAFLDRDGVLNVDRGYTHRCSDLIWTKGAREAVRMLNDAAYLVIVVTNQSGIARGYYDELQMNMFHDRMQEELAAFGAHVDAFYYCPYHAESVTNQFRMANHPDRKPNPGMILRAMSDWSVQAEGSFLIGDQVSDLGAAYAADLPAFHFDGIDLVATVRSALAQVGGRTWAGRAGGT